MKKLYLLLFLLCALRMLPLSATLALDEAQLIQKDFDEEYFEINQDFEKLRHILLHLVKTTGKMATYCEVKEHGKIEPDPSPLVNEVLPDLLIHALQIANYYDIDLSEKYAERREFIINRSAASQTKITP